MRLIMFGVLQAAKQRFAKMTRRRPRIVHHHGSTRREQCFDEGVYGYLGEPQPS